MEIMKDSTDEERISLDETLMKIVSLKGLSDEVLRSFWSAAEYQPPVESTESLSRRIVGLRLLAIVARFEIFSEALELKLNIFAGLKKRGSAPI